MDGTSVAIRGFVLTSPVTTLTNLGLAFLALWLAGRLSHRHSPAVRHWSRFLLLVGLGALAGVAKHGLKTYVSGVGATAVLVVTNLAVGVAVYHAEMATLAKNVRSPVARRNLAAVVKLQLAIFVAVVLIEQVFLVVVVHAAIGLLAVPLVELRAWLRGSRGAGWMFDGFAISSLTGVVYVARVSAGPWFNHIDLAHVLIAFGLACIFRGVRTWAQETGILLQTAPRSTLCKVNA